MHLLSLALFLKLDVLVVQFLAFRLSEVKLNCEHLTADLNTTMVSCNLALMKGTVSLEAVI